MGKDNDLTWCEYMKAWWATGTARINGNFAVAEELPSKTKYTSEWVLLETTLNGQVKQNVSCTRPSRPHEIVTEPSGSRPLLHTMRAP